LQRSLTGSGAIRGREFHQPSFGPCIDLAQKIVDSGRDVLRQVSYRGGTGTEFDDRSGH